MLYSVPISQPTPGHSAIFRCPASKDSLIKTYHPDIHTLQDVWQHTLASHSDRPCLGTIVDGKVQTSSYQEVDKQAHAIAWSMLKKELPSTVQNQGKKLSVIGICSENRHEWMVVDVACTLLGCTSVSLYDTLKQDGIDYAINLTALKTIFCSSSSLSLFIKTTSALQNLVYFDQPSEEDRKALEAKKINLVSYKEMLGKGAGQRVELAKLKPDDTYTLCFTSGTTGLPKAAMIDHEGMVMNIAASQLSLLKLFSEDIHMSYLPLPHVFERLIIIVMISKGALCVFYRGDPLKIIDDMRIVRPTVLISVPRILNRLYQGIKRTLLPTPDAPAKPALDMKMQLVKTKAQYTHPELDQKVFNKTKAIIGGRVRYIITGSAPISGQVLDFLKATLCCPLIEGYGQTESYAASFVTSNLDPLSGHVGGVTHATEFRLQDVPDLNYLSTDKNEEGQVQPRGEVCLRGAVIRGYLKDPERTKELIDQEGWLHTGDIGVILPNGALKLVDRKKNIFKLQQGEYIAPERVENVYVQHGIVSEIFVHGDSLQAFCVAVCTVQPARLQAVAKAVGAEVDLENLAIRKKILSELNDHARKIGLNGFELAKNIKLSSVPFMNTGILTTTMKMQRHLAKKAFEKEIVAMYAQGMII